METTKEKVLQILKDSVNQYCSGQEIAEKLYVTRASVWKAIRSLQKDGYRIEAVTNRGYCLIRSLDAMDAAKICSYLKEYSNGRKMTENAKAFLSLLSGRIRIYEEVDSTNTVVRQASEAPFVVISDRQTAGRGRRGRSFFSPPGSGIYLSLLLYPDDTIDLATGFTCMMALAVCKAVSSVLHFEPKIKWVNDIFWKGKKVCGILTEGNVSVEDNTISSVIIGMGINVYCPPGGFPKELENVAGSLLPGETKDPDLRNRLIAAILCEFASIYHEKDRRRFAEEYRERSMLIGKYVKITNFADHSFQYAYVENIDDNCHLLVRYDDGKREALSTGEVSVAEY